jgi:MFS family permease
MDPSVESGPQGVPWRKLAALTCFAVAIGVSINTLDPPLLAHRLLELAPATKNTALGVITLAGLLTAVIWQPLVGALSDRTRCRRGRRLPYLIAGTPIVMLGLLAVALVPTLGLLFLAVIVTQLGTNTIQGPWQALLPDRLPQTLRGRASGLKAAFEILGFVLGRQLAGQLIAAGQTLAAVALACLALLIALLITASEAGRPGNHTPATHAPPPPEHTSLRLRTPRGRAFAAWFANRALIWGGFIALNTFLIFFVIDALGMPEADAQRYVANVATLIGLLLLLIPIPAGWLADRIGRHRLLIAAGLLAASGTGLILLVRHPAGLMLAACLVGIGVGIFLSASWAWVTDLVPGSDAARYLGIANIATAGGSAAARLLGAALIDPLNRALGSNEGGYIAVYGLCLAAFVIGTLVVPRRGMSPPPAPVVPT